MFGRRGVAAAHCRHAQVRRTEVPKGGRGVDPLLRVVVRCRCAFRTRSPVCSDRVRPQSRIRAAVPARRRAARRAGTAASIRRPDGRCAPAPSRRCCRRTIPSRSVSAAGPARDSHRSRSRWCQWPSNVTSSCDHSCRNTATCSSMRRPRFEKSCSNASYSIQLRPMPTPSRNRPSVRRSSSAVCLASRTV